MRYALVNTNTSTVTNVIEWNGAEWKPPAGHLVVESLEANMGDIYDLDSNSFTAPPMNEE
jgi:hypothetical protein